MQRLGQHFLRSTSAITSILASLELATNDVIIEIGPGHGELTSGLWNSDRGLQIIAIERDEELARNLESRIQKSEAGNVRVIHGDALTILPELIAQLPRDYKLVGNIPYYITGHLLRIVSELERKPERAVFTIQKEVAERIIAEPPKMNRLAASTHYWADPKIIAIIPARDFAPPPKVDSAIILLERKTNATVDASRYYAAVRTIFAQPRKTILNNLANSHLPIATRVRTKQEIMKSLSEIGIDPEARPQNLDVQDIEAIAEKIF